MTKLKTYLCIFVSLLTLAGCQKINDPVVEYSSEKLVSSRYSGYDLLPTLPAKVRDMAQKHCEQFGKIPVYKVGKPVNLITTAGIHNLTCEIGKAKVQSV